MADSTRCANRLLTSRDVEISGRSRYAGPLNDQMQYRHSRAKSNVLRRDALLEGET